MEDVVIIGGGLSGASLLLACQSNGLSALMVEDKVVGGGGATAHSRGMVRVYDPQPELADYASAGLTFWREFGAEHPEVYTPIGLAYFLRPENIAKADDFIKRKDNKPHQMKLVPAAEIAERCNALNHDFVRDDRVAIWEPQAGHINPRAAARALTDRAQTIGATAIEGVKVRRVIDQSGVMRVETGFGGVNARRVIIATGAAPQFLTDPSAIETRSIVLSSFTSTNDKHPEVCLIDEATGCYLRPGQTGHFYVGGATAYVSTDPDEMAVDEQTAMDQNTGFRQILLEDAKAYSPLALHVGHDGYTHDFLPIIQDPGEGIAGAFCGFSGRGAKYIPTLAQSLVKTWINKGAL